MNLVPYHVIVQALENNDTAMIEKGRETCLAILKQAPDNSTCLRLMASIDFQTGNYAQTEEWLTRAIALQPDCVELCTNYALTCIKQEKYIQAVDILQKAAAAHPRNEELFFYLGVAQEAQGSNLEAVAAYQTACKLAPDNLEIVYQLGAALMKTEQFAEAETCFRRILELKPEAADALNNLGNILYLQGKFTPSIALYKEALKRQSGYLLPLGNLATALESAGLLTEAIATYRQALAISPDCTELQANLSMALLADGQLEEGWQQFEARLEMIRPFSSRQQIDKPVWRGQAGSGETLLIRAEQGFGDTLQFCRYVPLAAGLGYRVILEVQPPLVRLLQALPGAAAVYGYGDSLPDVDYYCPAMSLPLAFHTQLETIPGNTPYLTVPEEDRRKWQQYLAPHEQSLPKVGLVWAGKFRNATVELAVTARRRSLDAALLAPLLAEPGIQFFNLQKTGPAAPPEFSLINLMDACDDFADTAALIMNLDLVISVDTAVAHLAGALGKPVWLLNRFDSCWRWLRTREDSPWYPTLRIFRQPEPGDWPSVIAQVQTELHDWKTTLYTAKQGLV